MHCPRCEGLLMSDEVYNSEEALYVLPIWRCLNCGETFDSKILKHRNEQKTKEVLVRPKSTNWSDNRSPLAITR